MKTAKQKSDSEILGLHVCKKILKSVQKPKERIRTTAVETFNVLLTNRGRQIAEMAVQLANDKGRDSITREDIVHAHQIVQDESPFFLTLEEKAPMVHYVWFIGDNGTCYLSRSYSGLAFPDTLFSGLISGIINVCLEVTGRMINKIITEDLVIHARKGNNITVVVVSDTESPEPIDELVDLLTSTFEEKYGLLLESSLVDLSLFEDFHDILDQLVTASGMKLPTKMLAKYRLTEEAIEETVSAIGLKAEMKRAQRMIQEMPLFQKSQEEIISEKLARREKTDISEIMDISRSAQLAIRKEIENAKIEEEQIAETKVKEAIKKEKPVIKKKKPSTTPPKKKKSPAKKKSTKTTPKKKSTRKKKRK